MCKDKVGVAVTGALGRMGEEACNAIEEEPRLSLVARIDSRFDEEGCGCFKALESALSHFSQPIITASPDVLVDFTNAEAAVENARLALDSGVHVVVGTTGVDKETWQDIWESQEHENRSYSLLVIPNFSIGAVIMMRLAEIAARYMNAAEIIELHHGGKKDAPSGTAKMTAERIAKITNQSRAKLPDIDVQESRGQNVAGVQVHSIRLPGLVAHQEVIFGGKGQTLTIRHDSTDRISFMPGVITAIKFAATNPLGFFYGLDSILGI